MDIFFCFFVERKKTEKKETKPPSLPNPAPSCGRKPHPLHRRQPQRPASCLYAPPGAPEGGCEAAASSWLSLLVRSAQRSPRRAASPGPARRGSSVCAGCRGRSPSRCSRRRCRPRAWPRRAGRRGAAWPGRWSEGRAVAGFLLLFLVDLLLLDFLRLFVDGLRSADSRRSSRSGGGSNG